MPKTMARQQQGNKSRGLWLDRYVLGASTFLFPGQVGLWHARDTLASGTEASPEEVGLLFLKTGEMLQRYLEKHGAILTAAAAAESSSNGRSTISEGGGARVGGPKVLHWHEARSPGVVHRSDGSTNQVAALRRSGGSGQAQLDGAAFFPDSVDADRTQQRQTLGPGFACCVVLARGEGDEDEAELLKSDENHGLESAAAVHQGPLVGRLIEFLSPSFAFRFVSALEFRENCRCGCALCGQQQTGSTKAQIASAHVTASHSSSTRSTEVPVLTSATGSLPLIAATIPLPLDRGSGRPDLPQGDPAPAIDIAPSLSLDDLRAHLEQSEGRSFALDKKMVKRAPDPSGDILARLERTIEAQSRHITKLEEQIRTTTAERDKLRADRAEMDSRLSATTFLNETFLSGMMSGT
eukprot:INCI16391.16.p1 GENE.INCI16391.16~~INCI16391.16.p1  ORF type:complete len:409 (+),score=62.58 INCI16391.16:158-1384(+)